VNSSAFVALDTTKRCAWQPTFVMGRGRVGGLEQRSFLYRVINFED
jgi:hypothetical protein